MKEITNRQLEVLMLIYEGQKGGFSPTFFELRQKLGVSSNQTIKDLFDALVRKKYIVREPNKARAIILMPKAKHAIENISNFLSNNPTELNYPFYEVAPQLQWSGISNKNIFVTYGSHYSSSQITVDGSNYY